MLQAAAGFQVLGTATVVYLRRQPAGVDQVLVGLALHDTGDVFGFHVGEEFEAVGLEHRQGLGETGWLDFLWQAFEEVVEGQASGRGGGGPDDLPAFRFRLWLFWPGL